MIIERLFYFREVEWASVTLHSLNSDSSTQPNFNILPTWGVKLFYLGPLGFLPIQSERFYQNHETRAIGIVNLMRLKCHCSSLAQFLQ